jgi:hypothetical protein
MKIEEEYTKDDPLDLGLKYHFGSKSRYLICYREGDSFYWALGSVNEGTVEEIPEELYRLLVNFREYNNPELSKVDFVI